MTIREIAKQRQVPVIEQRNGAARNTRSTPCGEAVTSSTWSGFEERASKATCSVSTTWPLIAWTASPTCNKLVCANTPRVSRLAMQTGLLGDFVK